MGRLAPEMHVYALELPGGGRTEMPTTAALSLDDALALTVAFIEAFCLSQGLGPVRVLGHSFGGFLATHLALQHPARVSQLLLAAPAGLFPTLGPLGAYHALLFRFSLTHLPRRLGD